MNGDLKQTFILEVLREGMQMMEVSMRAAIVKNKIGVTDDLTKSIASDARMRGNGAVGELKFDESGRFVDMGVGRSAPLGGLKAVTEVLSSQDVKAISFIKKNRRRPKKWYSKIAYQKLSFIENKLMFGFTEEAKKELLKLRATNGI